MEVTQCFKCCMFGHVSKYCKHDASCYKCRGHHDGKDYTNESWNCINCEKVKVAVGDRKHGARDMRKKKE